MSGTAVEIRLTLVRREPCDFRREAGVRREVDRTVPNPVARWVFAEEAVALPVAGRADGTRLEAAAAVRADIPENALDAGGAEGALVGADARFGRGGGQGLVAVLAGRPQLEHQAGMASTRLTADGVGITRS